MDANNPLRHLTVPPLPKGEALKCVLNKDEECCDIRQPASIRRGRILKVCNRGGMPARSLIALCYSFLFCVIELLGLIYRIRRVIYTEFFEDVDVNLRKNYGGMAFGSAQKGQSAHSLLGVRIGDGGKRERN